MHVVVGVLRYGFLLLLFLFVLYIVLLIRKRLGD
jgi:hypothetical protein